MGAFGDLVKIFKPKQYNEQSTQPENLDDDYGFEQTLTRRDYGNQELNFLADQASSRYLPGLIELISSQNQYTEEFKVALIKACAALLGVDMLYANNNPTQTGKDPVKNHIQINALKADIVLEMLVLSATKNDINNIDLVSFIKILELEFGALQSRTIGANRERLIVTELKSTMKSVSEKVPTGPRGEPEKKKTWSLFG